MTANLVRKSDGRILGLSCILVLITITSSAADKQLSMPSWFWDMPSDINQSERWAVGYSRPHRDSDHAYDDAFLEGAWRLFSDGHSLVKGESGTASTPRGTMHLGRTLRFSEIDSSAFNVFLKTVVRIDSASTETLRVMLVATGNIKVGRARIVQPSVGFENENNRKLTTGAAQIYHFQMSSWIEAEREARLQLATNVYSKIRAIDKSVTAFSDSRKMIDLNSRITTIETNAVLRNVRTVRRRFDTRSNIITVWISGDAIPAGDD